MRDLDIPNPVEKNKAEHIELKRIIKKLVTKVNMLEHKFEQHIEDEIIERKNLIKIKESANEKS